MDTPQNQQKENVPTGVMGNVMPKIPPSRKKPIGPIFAIFIIVVLLILGGLYFWRDALNQKQGNPSSDILKNNSGTATPATLVQ
jgi:hypothetical protein